MAVAVQVLLGICYPVAFLYVSILVHEAGHAICALAVRLPLKSIEFGTGRRVASLRIRGVEMTFRLLPKGGVTRARGIPTSRACYIVYALGGIAANILFAVVGIVILWHIQLRWQAALFGLFNLGLVLENLIPRPAHPPRRSRPNDGKLVFGLIFHPDQHLRPSARPFAVPPTLASKMKDWEQHPQPEEGVG